MKEGMIFLQKRDHMQSLHFEYFLGGGEDAKGDGNSCSSSFLWLRQGADLN